MQSYTAVSWPRRTRQKEPHLMIFFYIVRYIRQYHFSLLEYTLQKMLSFWGGLGGGLEAQSDLLLHHVLEVRDPLCILRVTADVVLVEKRLLKRQRSKGQDNCTHEPMLCVYLLVSGDAAIHRGVDDPVEAHAERVDVAVMLSVLVLAD